MLKLHRSKFTQKKYYTEPIICLKNNRNNCIIQYAASTIKMSVFNHTFYISTNIFSQPSYNFETFLSAKDTTIPRFHNPVSTHYSIQYYLSTLLNPVVIKHSENRHTLHYNHCYLSIYMTHIWRSHLDLKVNKSIKPHEILPNHTRPFSCLHGHFDLNQML